jgi:hypothetical protein
LDDLFGVFRLAGARFAADTISTQVSLPALLKKDMNGTYVMRIL